ncbi:MAG TPA: hypothetical protein VGS22_08665 [Thermoanaerobaculia bacterium]|jgi:hypothetical protein|nr:hypothetical protein [Thermoanaerobaculia bacterium]
MNRQLVFALLSIAALSLPALAATPQPEAPLCSSPEASQATFPSYEFPAAQPLTSFCGTCGVILSCRGVQIGAPCTGISGAPGVCEPTGKLCVNHLPQCACF